MRLMSSCVLIYAMSSLQRCLPCIFVINVVTSTSMQTRHHDVTDFSPCSAVILMPCKQSARKHFEAKVENENDMLDYSINSTKGMNG